MTYRLGSLFDGSGGFPLAAALCGIEPVWAAEVEPYPIAVTKSRFPSMKHLGSVTDINGSEIEPVDIITFGSPCQDLSVAGKRAGLKHEANGDDETTRSGLFMEAVRIIKEMREATNGEYPTFAVWENVPGAFSSNKGEDFRTVLEELIKIVEPSAVMPAVPKGGWPHADSYCGDGWSLAYRVFDAQYWGVPQRRRRIYLVLDLRGQRAGKVSFEREGVRGNFATFKTAGQGTAGDAANSTGADDCEGERNCLTPWDVQSRRIFSVDGPWPALYGGEGGGHGYACIPINTMIATRHKQLGRGTGFGVGEAGDPQFTISAGHEHAVAYTLKIRSGCEGGGKGALIQENKSATLATNNDQYLFQPANMVLDDQGGQQITVRTDGKAPTLRAETHGNLPCVLEAAGFKAGQSMAGGIGWQKECAATLAAQCSGTEPTVCIKECLPFDTTQVTSPQNGCNPKWGDPCHPLAAQGHPPTVICKCYDARGNGDGQTVSTLTGDHENRITDYTTVICLQGNGIDRADTAGCNGKGWKEDTSYTLNTVDRPAVAYSIGNGQLNQMSMSEQCNTLDCMHDKQAVIVFDKEVYNSGANATGGHYMAEDGPAPSLRTGQPPGVCVRYIVRRLTPTEYARLQGFPDNWGHPDHKDSFTQEELSFWKTVRDIYAAINGKSRKDYTEAQMLKWYNSLHTDSAEYKMWGNGIALPTALYVMQGISDALNELN